MFYCCERTGKARVRSRSGREL